MNLIEEREIRHFHFYVGLGGGAEGFNRGQARVGNMRSKMVCIGGVDSDPAAIRDCHRRGIPATLLDLFDRQQYIDFHGHEPPEGWREATVEDIRKAAGYRNPHMVFLSAPCKGFSGLLSETKSLGKKYQALNRLTLRGVFLMLEAWADDPPELIIFENVPRIATRGAGLIDKICAMFHAYGYATCRDTHNCGELGGLGQSRVRFLLVARHIAKVPPFLYQPPKRPLRAVGEILGRMPLPGDVRGGPMHSIPNLQWKTWVRLAFVRAGSDWRSLNDLQVKDGFLRDYLIIPEQWYAGILGVQKWEEPSCTVTGRADPTTRSFAIADPRAFDAHEFRRYGVCDWDEPKGAVTGQRTAGQGYLSVADPRFKGHEFQQYGVKGWDEASATVTSQSAPGGGPFSVSDPRIDGIRHNNIFRIVRWDEHSQAVTAGNGPTAGGQAVADPRPPLRPLFRKYYVTPWNENTGTVIGGHRSEEGAYAVADPRTPNGEYKVTKYKVNPWDEPTRAVIGASTAGDGAFAVADPRPNLIRAKGDNYLTGGHYGVLPWDSPSYAVTSGKYDNGPWSVADVRMPATTEKLVCVIRSLDNTWHRPFTTLELAALQSLVDPEQMFSGEPFDLDGKSDSSKRERIGNAVPPAAAEVIASQMAKTLLMAWSGETFQLSNEPIWVRDLSIALSVKTLEEMQR